MPFSILRRCDIFQWKLFASFNSPLIIVPSTYPHCFLLKKDHGFFFLVRGSHLAAVSKNTFQMWIILHALPNNTTLELSVRIGAFRAILELLESVPVLTHKCRDTCKNHNWILNLGRADQAAPMRSMINCTSLRKPPSLWYLYLLLAERIASRYLGSAAVISIVDLRHAHLW